MYEVRLHGRGGQLLQQASQVLASALMAEGKQVQLAPQPGSNRVGTPAAMFLKVDDRKIAGGCRVLEPDCVVVFDDKLPRFVGVYDGLKRGGLVIINTKNVNEALNIGGEAIRVACVDANRIASEVYGPAVFPKVGPAMLGAFVRGSELVRLDSIAKALESHFPEEKKEHIKAVERAYEETYVKALGGCK